MIQRRVPLPAVSLVVYFVVCGRFREVELLDAWVRQLGSSKAQMNAHLIWADANHVACNR